MSNHLAESGAHADAHAPRPGSAAGTDVGTERALERERALDVIGQLAGGLAHDLNNLLTIVLGNLQLLKRRCGDAPAVARRLDAALGASSRAAELTRRLLGISHLQPMRLESVDAAALVGELAAQLQRTWGDSVTVETRIEPGVGPVWTDRSQLQAALVSLCLNARDALAPGGRLELGVRASTSPGRPAADAPEPGAWVAFEVHDDGAGMTPEVLARAFDPFFTTKEQGAGAGLGLSIVQGFARRARGAVDLRSAPGQGTSAILHLPQAAGTPTLAGPPRHADARESPRRATVLVVDDDEDIREFAASVLRDAGYAVSEAAGGRSALELLRGEQRFDLLLTDVLMPGGISGRDVAGEARARRGGIPVLYASGYAPDTLLREGRLEPHESFVAKPYSADELLRSVQAAIERGEAS